MPAWAHAGEFVIVPGQESLLGEMVGMTVPAVGGCKLDTAAINKDRVNLAYDCDKSSRVELTLVHPNRGDLGKVVATTGKFAIVGKPPVPELLRSELVELIRKHEKQWNWVEAVPGRKADGPRSDEPGAPSFVHVGSDPKKYAEYKKGVTLYDSKQHHKALDYFLAMAKKDPTYAGVLGMVVANLAPTQPTRGDVDAYINTADAAPDDPLLQFVAGVAAHYSAHYRARSKKDKADLYALAITYLSRARPAFDFEARIYIYLAVSHFRLGHQAQAEAFIEDGVRLTPEDPDVYYCRAEIFHRTKVDRSFSDIEKYLALVEDQRKQGTAVSSGKIERVRNMRDYLRDVAAGKKDLVELWDPLEGTTPGNVIAFSSPRRFGTLVAVMAGALLLVFLFTRFLRKRRAHKRNP